MQHLIIFLASMISFVAMTMEQATADGAGYRVCNNTSKPYAFSYIYRHGLGVLRDRWTWQGHYKIDAGNCELLMPTHNAAHIYLNIRKLQTPRSLGPDVILTDAKIRSSNRQAEVVNEKLCEYESGGPSVARPLSGRKRCSDSSKRTYTVFWQGIGQSHRDISMAPHTLHLNYVFNPAM